MQLYVIPGTQLSSICIFSGWIPVLLYLVLSMQLFHVASASYLSECKSYKLLKMTKFHNNWVYEKGPCDSQSFRLINGLCTIIIIMYTVPWKLLASKLKGNGS